MKVRDLSLNYVDYTRGSERAQRLTEFQTSLECSAFQSVWWQNLTKGFLARKPHILQYIDLGADDNDNDGVDGKGKSFFFFKNYFVRQIVHTLLISKFC